MLIPNASNGLTEQEDGDARLGRRILKELLTADRPMRAEELLDIVR